MNKEIAQGLSNIVSTKSFIYLKEYTKSRIEYHMKELSNSTNYEQMLRHQGAIKELQRFEFLYEEVKKELKG